jgi:hypothetical protein
MPRPERKKSKPMTVRFPHELQEWIDKESAQYAAGKTGLVVDAVESLREKREDQHGNTDDRSE